MEYLLVPELADISLSGATNQTSFNKIQDHIATMNLIVVAQFFHITCIAIINHFIAFGRLDDLQGPISYHDDVVERNSCNMLHLHSILWLSGNMGLLLKDEVYAFQMIIYLNTIISYCVDEAILQTSILLSNICISPSALGCKADSNGVKLINHDSNATAIIK